MRRRRTQGKKRDRLLTNGSMPSSRLKKPNGKKYNSVKGGRGCSPSKERGGGGIPKRWWGLWLTDWRGERELTERGRELTSTNKKKGISIISPKRKFFSLGVGKKEKVASKEGQHPLDRRRKRERWGGGGGGKKGWLTLPRKGYLSKTFRGEILLDKKIGDRPRR